MAGSPPMPLANSARAASASADLAGATKGGMASSDAVLGKRRQLPLHRPSSWQMRSPPYFLSRLSMILGPKTLTASSHAALVLFGNRSQISSSVASAVLLCTSTYCSSTAISSVHTAHGVPSLLAATGDEAIVIAAAAAGCPATERRLSRTR